MIQEEKIRCMTNVAMQKKKAREDEEIICRYKRKDYIGLHVFVIWLLSTISYLILTGLRLVSVLGKNLDQAISIDIFRPVSLAWGIGYVIFCLFFCIVAYFRYSNRFSRARGWQIRYHRVLRHLEDYYRQKPKNDDVWMVEEETRDGRAGKQ